MPSSMRSVWLVFAALLAGVVVSSLLWPNDNSAHKQDIVSLRETFSLPHSMSENSDDSKTQHAVVESPPEATNSKLPSLASPPDNQRNTDNEKNAQQELSGFITRVVDGDTVIARLADGELVRVRAIGINTPESVDPRRPVECFGKEAAARAREFLEGREVILRLDPTQGTHDRYGRLLAYIFRDDGLFFNLEMIAEGYAHEYTYRIPHQYQQTFQEVERAAREAQRGLWDPRTCNGNPS
ncbi:hypothetical protein D6792_03550 [Candidatus Parcubacteria bacterium]|nr:MAG: hypothetical protein D6792_03550 [Candidatus Parcubacteria bacterium]